MRLRRKQGGQFDGRSGGGGGNVSHGAAAVLAVVAFGLGQLSSTTTSSVSSTVFVGSSSRSTSHEKDVAVAAVDSRTLTSSQPQQQQAQEKNNAGWSTIDVFYGTANHLEIPPKYQGRSWYSQVTQDQVVAGLLRNKTAGYFIDLAANDAVSLSNTYGLEQNLDWNGLCIEANSQYWKRLAYRKCQVVGAVVGAVRDEEVLFTFKGEYGGIAGNKKKDLDVAKKAATVPLLEIFQRHKVPNEIDYLSLDVEGAEAFILMQFPLDQYRIKIMTVERMNPEGRAFLKQHGYEENVRLGAIGEGLFVHESVLAEMDWSVVTDKFDCHHLPDFECARPFNIPATTTTNTKNIVQKK